MHSFLGLAACRKSWRLANYRATAGQFTEIEHAGLDATMLQTRSQKIADDLIAVVRRTKESAKLIHDKVAGIQQGIGQRFQSRIKERVRERHGRGWNSESNK